MKRLDYMYLWFLDGVDVVLEKQSYCYYLKNHFDVQITIFTFKRFVID